MLARVSYKTSERKSDTISVKAERASERKRERLLAKTSSIEAVRIAQ